jgi:hypothetical protein
LTCTVCVLYILQGVDVYVIDERSLRTYDSVIRHNI